MGFIAKPRLGLSESYRRVIGDLPRCYRNAPGGSPNPRLSPLGGRNGARIARTIADIATENAWAGLTHLLFLAKIDENQQLLSGCSCTLPLAAALAAARGRGGGCGRVWSSGHARAVAETAGCRLGSRRSRRRARLELRRRARADAEGGHRRGKSPPGRSLGRLVGRSVGSGRAFDFLWWCALSGVVCGGWGSGFPCPRILDFMGVPPLFASRLLSWTLYVCACWHDSFVELRLASRVPVSSSVSSWLARGIAIAGGSTRLLAVITRVPPRLAVRCALFSVFVGVGRFSGDNKIGRLFGGASLWGFALGLRFGASPSGFAFGLRLRASPSGFAFGLRLRARPNPRLDS